MKSYKEKLNKIESSFSDKLKIKLKLETLRNLLNKIATNEDEQLNERLDRLFEELDEILKQDKPSLRTYLKKINDIKKYVKEKWGYVAKGTLVGEYMAMGMAIGLAMGTAFVSINPALISIGLPIGIAVGLSIGNHKENELEKEGKIY